MGWETLYVGKLLVEAEASAFLQSSVRANTKQWKKGQVWPFYGSCTADSRDSAVQQRLACSFFPLLGHITTAAWLEI